MNENLFAENGCELPRGLRHRKHGGAIIDAKNRADSFVEINDVPRAETVWPCGSQSWFSRGIHKPELILADGQCFYTFHGSPLSNGFHIGGEIAWILDARVGIAAQTEQAARVLPCLALPVPMETALRQPAADFQCGSIVKLNPYPFANDFRQAVSLLQFRREDV